MKRQQDALSTGKTETLFRPWLSLVGMSESGWAGIAEEGRAAIAQASLLVGSQRQLHHVPEQVGQRRMLWPSPIQAGIDEILKHQGQQVCVLASGDPFWFGIGATLSRHLPHGAIRSLPGASAFSMAAARQAWPLQDCLCLSLVARDPENLRRAFAPGRRLLVLSENGSSPARLAELLCEAGFANSPLWAWQRMGGEAETCRQALAKDWRDTQVDALNTVAVECVPSRVDAGMSRSAGRPEDDFIHDGQISKREVRAVILAYLAPKGGEHLWDLGGGSGAVSVEWLLADQHNSATVVERREDRCLNIQANAKRFGLPQLHCVQGDCSDVIADLAPPSAVFIGGGVTSDGLLERCWQALSVGGRIVASAVTIEGEAALISACQHYGGNLSRIAVERSEALGGFKSMTPQRSVTIWHANKTLNEKERY